jgi:hypothetical protein
MIGNEFIRKLKAYGKKRGVHVALNASRGKGAIRRFISAAHLRLFVIQKMN